MDYKTDFDMDFKDRIMDISETESSPEPKVFVKDLPLSDKIKNKIYGYIEYAGRFLNDRCDRCNCTFIGCPERLAPMIISSIANELDCNVRITNAAIIEKPGDLAALLTNVNPCDIIAILNIQQMNCEVKEIFSQAIADYTIDVITGKGQMAASYHLPLPVFIAILPVKCRQDIPAEMEESLYYEIDFSSDKTAIRKGIVYDILQKQGLKITDEALNQLARSDISNSFLKSKAITIRNRAIVQGVTTIGVELLEDVVDSIPGLDTVDQMDGREFEVFTGNLFRLNGFVNVTVTPCSGDFGADVIAEKDDVKFAIQCKRFAEPVGVSAVQEVIASKSLHDCHVACVLTNSSFTPAAEELAKKNLVILWNRNKLKALIEKASEK